MGVTRFVLAAVTILVAAMSYSALKPHSESDLLSDWSGEPPPWPVFIGVNVAASLLRKAADALTPPPIQMADLANGYHKTVLAFMLQKFKIPDLVAAGPKSAAEVAAATQTSNVDHVERLLYACAAHGMLQLGSPAADGTPRFVNTALSAVLRRDHPNSAAGFVGHSFEETYPAWHRLPDMFGPNPKPLAWDLAFPEYPATKGGIWALFEAKTEREEQFTRAMAGLDGLGATAMIRDGPFSKFSRVIDIGGSRGHFLNRLLAAYPSMQGVLLDRPPVIAIASKLFAKDGVYNSTGSRAKLVSGSFFEPSTIPRAADGDAYYLRYILHDWPVKDVEHILKNVRAAMGSSHATLLIGECAIPDRDRVPIPPILAAIDIQMMAVFPEAKERTPSEWRVLLSKSGFKVVALHGTRSLVQWVEAVPI